MLTASAQNSGRLVAIVNDEPISEYDVDQRVRFNQNIRGARGSADQLRRNALQELIDNVLKRQEAERFSLGVSDAQVDASYESMATRAGVTQQQWQRQLNDGGIAVSTIKLEVQSALSWRRVVQLRFGQRIQVETEDVDRAYSNISNDPQDPSYVYVIQRVLLPLEQDASSQLQQTRLQEAQSVMQRISGCGSVSSAASNVFNVRVLGRQSIPSEALSSEMRTALRQAGVGNAVGPGATDEGIMIFVYCDLQTIEAPVPTREDVEEQLLYEKFERIGTQFLRDLRRDAIIEYRDPDLAS